VSERLKSPQGTHNPRIALSVFPRSCPAPAASVLQLACEPGDVWCRRRQRQALLHWAYDSRKL